MGTDAVRVRGVDARDVRHVKLSRVESDARVTGGDVENAAAAQGQVCAWRLSRPVGIGGAPRLEDRADARAPAELLHPRRAGRPEAVDVADFQPEERGPGLGDARPPGVAVFAVNRPAARRDHHVLLQAFEVVHHRQRVAGFVDEAAARLRLERVEGAGIGHVVDADLEVRARAQRPESGVQSLFRGHGLHQGEGDRQGDGGHQPNELDRGDRALAQKVERRKPGEAHSAKYADRNSEVPPDRRWGISKDLANSRRNRSPAASFGSSEDFVKE
ncbi:MAG: hypothetical protein E6J28_10505 [Chloroflexi bacterium]|nr:MAG: hypothetical protein E6J28_10505 [Chloroflexota bacterium]